MRGGKGTKREKKQSELNRSNGSLRRRDHRFRWKESPSTSREKKKGTNSSNGKGGMSRDKERKRKESRESKTKREERRSQGTYVLIENDSNICKRQAAKTNEKK